MTIVRDGTQCRVAHVNYLLGRICNLPLISASPSSRNASILYNHTIHSILFLDLSIDYGGYPIPACYLVCRPGPVVPCRSLRRACCYSLLDYHMTLLLIDTSRSDTKCLMQYDSSHFWVSSSQEDTKPSLHGSSQRAAQYLPSYWEHSDHCRLLDQAKR